MGENEGTDTHVTPGACAARTTHIRGSGETEVGKRVPLQAAEEGDFPSWSQPGSGP